MKDQIFKVVYIQVSKHKYQIQDVEKIRAQSLKNATQLARDIQVAETQQDLNIDFYADAYISFEHKIGIVGDGSQNVNLIIGKDNGWFEYINDSKSQKDWKEIIMLEWEDYINELLLLEESEMVEV